MPFFRDCAGGATGHALPAFPVRVKKAVIVVMAVFSRGRRDLNFDNQRATAHGFALFGYQAITQAEGAKSGDIGGVAFRPVGSKPVFSRSLSTPGGGKSGGNGGLVFLTKNLCQMTGEVDICLLAKAA